MVHTIDMPGKSRGMTVKRLLTSAAKKLHPRRITCPADRSVGWLEAEILLAHVLQKDRVWLVAHEDEPVHDRPARKFRSLVARRVKLEPIAYLTGNKEFYGRDFVVGPHTLIPRPESELFIERLTATLKRDGNYLFCDIGAGSGAIAVTLALEFPRSRVVATDVDAHALQTARVNAARYKVAGRMSFIKEDLLGRKVRHELRPSTRPLVLVANLPYVSRPDHDSLQPEVRCWEPISALCPPPLNASSPLSFSSFSPDDDGLDLVIELLEEAPRVHAREVWLEHGHSEAVIRRLSSQKGYLRSFPDLTGRTRFSLFQFT